MKFSGVITIDKRNVSAKDQGQRSKLKVIEINPNFAQILAFGMQMHISLTEMKAKPGSGLWHGMNT